MDRDDADMMHFLHALTLKPEGGVKAQGDGMKATNARNDGVKRGRFAFRAGGRGLLTVHKRRGSVRNMPCSINALGSHVRSGTRK